MINRYIIALATSYHLITVSNEIRIRGRMNFLRIENQATWKVCSCNMKDIILEPPIEFWNIDTQFGRAGRYINHPANLPIITLNG